MEYKKTDKRNGTVYYPNGSTSPPDGPSSTPNVLAESVEGLTIQQPRQ